MCTRKLECGNCGHSLTRPDIEIPPSPFPHFLNGNHSAEGAQIGVIHDAITASSRKISVLDDEISRLEGALIELRHKRVTLASYAVAHRGLLAPIRQVPNDILVEIFMHFRVEWGRKAKCSAKPGPLSVTGVCRYWRNIALDMAPLWSSIPIRLRYDANSYIEDMLKTWLVRAKSRSLSISLSIDAYSVGPRLGSTRYTAKKMMGVLMDSCTQWLDLHMEPRYELRQILAPLKHLFPNLRQLSLSGGDNYNQGDPWDLFEAAPQLSSLTYFVNSTHRTSESSLLIGAMGKPCVPSLSPPSPQRLQHRFCQN